MKYWKFLTLILSLIIGFSSKAFSQTINTVVGNGVVGGSGDGNGGPATDATFLSAWPIVFDAAGNLYFADHSELSRYNTGNIHFI